MMTKETNPAVMERRLSDGYTRIEEAKRQGQDVTAWEDFWIGLLRDYEQAIDEATERFQESEGPRES